MASEVPDIDDDAWERLTEEQRACERLQVQFPEYWVWWDSPRFVAGIRLRPDYRPHPRSTRAATEAELAEMLTKRRPAHLKRWARYLYTEDWQLTPLPETPPPAPWPHGKPPETREEGEEESRRLHTRFPDYEVHWNNERRVFVAKYKGGGQTETPTEKMMGDHLKSAAKKRGRHAPSRP